MPVDLVVVFAAGSILGMSVGVLTAMRLTQEHREPLPTDVALLQALLLSARGEREGARRRVDELVAENERLAREVAELGRMVDVQEAELELLCGEAPVQFTRPA